MESYDVTVHDDSLGPLPLVVCVLLVLFFPIGIIVLIVRTASRIKNEHTERQKIRAQTQEIKTKVSLANSAEIAAFHELYKRGILTEAEFEEKKRAVLLNKKFNPKALGPKALDS